MNFVTLCWLQLLVTLWITSSVVSSTALLSLWLLLWSHVWASSFSAAYFFPSIRVFSKESCLLAMCLKQASFSFIFLLPAMVGSFWQTALLREAGSVYATSSVTESLFSCSPTHHHYNHFFCFLSRLTLKFLRSASHSGRKPTSWPSWAASPVNHWKGETLAS